MEQIVSWYFEHFLLFFLYSVTSKMVIKFNQNDLVNILVKLLILLIYVFPLYSARYILRAGLESYSYLYVQCQEALYKLDPQDIFPRLLNWNDQFP